MATLLCIMVLVLCLSLLLSGFPAFAQSVSAQTDRIAVSQGIETSAVEDNLDMVALLGLALDQVLDRYGAPKEVFPLRGMEAWQDDVVFYYPSNLYFFFFGNRVWQVRIDKRYSGKALGFSPGTPKQEVIARLGTPFYQDQDSLIYLLPDRGYPVRSRFFFENEILSDIYVYRGDF